ncbi:hypothetical protein OH77DRAFT_1301075 [Trametes cingulata]|nr:hypothetical protein OH77DRAFT_1301075 [Trametes cingulata]
MRLRWYRLPCRLPSSAHSQATWTRARSQHIVRANVKLSRNAAPLLSSQLADILSSLRGDMASDIDARSHTGAQLQSVRAWRRSSPTPGAAVRAPPVPARNGRTCRTNSYPRALLLLQVVDPLEPVGASLSRPARLLPLNSPRCCHPVGPGLACFAFCPRHVRVRVISSFVPSALQRDPEYASATCLLERTAQKLRVDRTLTHVPKA